MPRFAARTSVKRTRTKPLISRPKLNGSSINNPAHPISEGTIDKVRFEVSPRRVRAFPSLFRIAKPHCTPPKKDRMIAPYVRKAYPGLSIQTDVSVTDRTVIITKGVKPSRPSHLAPEGTIINGHYPAIIVCHGYTHWQ